MTTSLHSARLILSLFIGFGLLPTAAAQWSNTPAEGSPVRLSPEEVVTNLVQRNAERALALAAYQGTRIYRLE